MPKGKQRCKILKEIRKQIAKENDIEFVTSECKYKGDCAGTCPKCEAELRFLESELEKRRIQGLKVSLAGVAASIAMTACFEAGCSTTLAGEPEQEYYRSQDSSIVVERTAGVLVADESKEIIIPQGDMRIEESSDFVEGEFDFTDESAFQSDTHFHNFPKDFIPNEINFDEGLSRKFLLSFWEEYFIESGNEYDVFSAGDEYVFIVYYDKDDIAQSGKSVTVEEYEQNK